MSLPRRRYSLVKEQVQAQGPLPIPRVSRFLRTGAHHLEADLQVFRGKTRIRVEENGKIAVSRGALLTNTCAPLHAFSCGVQAARLEWDGVCGRGSQREEGYPQIGTDPMHAP